MIIDAEVRTEKGEFPLRKFAPGQTFKYAENPGFVIDTEKLYMVGYQDDDYDDNSVTVIDLRDGMVHRTSLDFLAVFAPVKIVDDPHNNGTDDTDFDTSAL